MTSLLCQGFGVAFYIWVFVGLIGLDERGAWFGVAAAALSGLALSLLTVTRVARREIGSLWRAAAPGAHP